MDDFLIKMIKVAYCALLWLFVLIALLGIVCFLIDTLK